MKASGNERVDRVGLLGAMNLTRKLTGQTKKVHVYNVFFLFESI